MNKLKLATKATQLVVGASVSFVTHQVIKNNTDADNIIQKGEIAVASFVLGAMVADAAEAHIVKRIAETQVQWNEMKQKIQEAKEQLEEKVA